MWICFGHTDYKHHQGTNMVLEDADAPDDVRAPDVRAWLANALGCAAMVITVDDYLVLQQRSSEVGVVRALGGPPRRGRGR